MPCEPVVLWWFVFLPDPNFYSIDPYGYFLCQVVRGLKQTVRISIRTYLALHHRVAFFKIRIGFFYLTVCVFLRRGGIQHDDIVSDGEISPLCCNKGLLSFAMGFLVMLFRLQCCL